MGRSRNSTDRHWAYVVQARQVANALYAETRQPVTIDDVTTKLPLPEGLNTHLLGSVFRQPEWKRVGYRQSAEKVGGKRPIGLFVPSVPDNRLDVDKAGKEDAIASLLNEVRERLNRVETTLHREDRLDIADLLILQEDIRRTNNDLEVATKRLEVLKSKADR